MRFMDEIKENMKVAGVSKENAMDREKWRKMICYDDPKREPARWCSGESVRIAVGRPWVHSLSRVIPKHFKNWYSQLPCLALSIKREQCGEQAGKLACCVLGQGT